MCLTILRFDEKAYDSQTCFSSRLTADEASSSVCKMQLENTRLDGGAACLLLA